jgi:hypothetical protein
MVGDEPAYETRLVDVVHPLLALHTVNALPNCSAAGTKDRQNLAPAKRLEHSVLRVTASGARLAGLTCMPWGRLRVSLMSCTHCSPSTRLTPCPIAAQLAPGTDKTWRRPSGWSTAF